MTGDQIVLVDEEKAELLAGGQVIIGKPAIPTYLRVAVFDRCGQASAQSALRDMMSVVEAEVRRVVIEEHAEVPNAVASPATTDDDAVQRDQRVSSLHQLDQSGPVGGRVLSREIPDDK